MWALWTATYTPSPLPSASDFFSVARVSSVAAIRGACVRMSAVRRGAYMTVWRPARAVLALSWSSVVTAAVA